MSVSISNVSWNGKFLSGESILDVVIHDLCIYLFYSNLLTAQPPKRLFSYVNERTQTNSLDISNANTHNSLKCIPLVGHLKQRARCLTFPNKHLGCCTFYSFISFGLFANGNLCICDRLLNKFHKLYAYSTTSL